MSPEREEAVKALDRLSDEQLHDVIHSLTQDPRVKRRVGFKGWWYRYAGSVAFVSIVLTGAAGFFVVDNTIDTIEAERAARAESVSGIIDLFCSTNNAQDAALASLVDVSLNGQDSFGKGVEDLSAFATAVVTAIREVQAKSADPVLTEVFEEVLADLKEPTRCGQLVRRFQAGKEIPPPMPPPAVED